LISAINPTIRYRNLLSTTL